ncbi:hypothetical protein PESP_a3232 [Pseudoalteromonas espejiana DSM 9414]|uniref:CAAX prenyl protease 2/Lysostaphin resistance protein A-like domain-containing protein n=1 Tax=Pseudoalteromonas espejiana TaxID=28107 RepID=A0A510Y2J4_9GAMM|nr:CPBP family glutamic-type intramembrane protease [Pseudoalteromonas espejiana]ASM51079.1 hypothetical protein PESP_a3232 [Pseudoalteromonas espejiana DSM 9414]GEK57071.1 hypothetical protein PES01_39160 [Pseudoalteromonas espejiana]
MEDAFIAVFANVGVIFILTLILKALNKVDINITWSLISLGIFTCYVFALFRGAEVIPLDIFFADLSWNWSGKIAVIILWGCVLFALAKYKRGFSIVDAGFTFRQIEGSTKPALIVLCLFVMLQAIVSLFWSGEPRYDLETLLYQATMPGLDEEPMFRGVLLFCISLAIVSKRYCLAGAPLNVGGLLLVLLFGLLHGVMFSDGEWHFLLISILLTGSYGFILLWLRERTGSLIFPVIAHNCVNVVGQLI